MPLGDVKAAFDLLSSVRQDRARVRSLARDVTVAPEDCESQPHARFTISNDGAHPITYLNFSLWRINEEWRLVEHLGCHPFSRIRPGSEKQVEICLDDAMPRILGDPIAFLLRFTDAEGREWVRFNNDLPQPWGWWTRRRYAREHPLLGSCEGYGDLSRAARPELGEAGSA